jgi:putative nucleotidyltransferase with HDIG domain
METPVGMGRELPSVNVTAIPPLPAAALHILSVARKSTVSAAEVAEALGTDPSIALRFLSIANSAFFSANQRITTLSHCVAWLGLEFVKATLVSLTIGDDGGGVESPYLTRTTLWQHNMGVAACCEMICNRIRGWQPGEAYTTGLTHDVGKQILLQTHGDEYRECLARAATENEELFLLEDEVLGFDHALVGALALREWKLGPELVHVVLNHHEAQLATEHGKMIAVLQLAHEICRQIGYGNGPDAALRLDGAARERLHLDDETVDGIVSELAESVESLDTIIQSVAA